MLNGFLLAHDVCILGVKIKQVGSLDLCAAIAARAPDNLQIDCISVACPELMEIAIFRLPSA